MLIAALPEGFEVLADPVGDPLGELATIDSGEAILVWNAMRATTSASASSVAVASTQAVDELSPLARLRGDYVLRDRNDDLVGSRGG